MQRYNKIKKVFLISTSVVSLLLIFLLGEKNVNAAIVYDTTSETQTGTRSFSIGTYTQINQAEYLGTYITPSTDYEVGTINLPINNPSSTDTIDLHLEIWETNTTSFCGYVQRNTLLYEGDIQSYTYAGATTTSWNVYPEVTLEQGNHYLIFWVADDVSGTHNVLSYAGQVNGVWSNCSNGAAAREQTNTSLYDNSALPNGMNIFGEALSLKFSIDDTSISPNTTIGIITTYPTNGSTIASTTVELGADVYNDQATEVCWFLQNLDLGQSIVPICGELFASGETSTSVTTVLAAGYYTGYAEMIGSAGEENNIVKNVNFFVIASAFYGMSTPNGNIFGGQGFSTTTDMGTWCENNFDSNLILTLCMLPQRIIALLVSVIYSENSLTNITTQREALQESIENKLPFAIYFELKTKLENISATSTAPDNIVVHLQGMGTTTMINFAAVREQAGELINAQVIEVISNIAWLLMSIFLIIAVFKILI